MAKKLMKLLCTRGHALHLKQLRVLPRCGVTHCEGRCQPIFVPLSFPEHHCGEAARGTYSNGLGLLTLSDGRLEFLFLKIIRIPEPF